MKYCTFRQMAWNILALFIDANPNVNTLLNSQAHVMFKSNCFLCRQPFHKWLQAEGNHRKGRIFKDDINFLSKQ